MLADMHQDCRHLDRFEPVRAAAAVGAVAVKLSSWSGAQNTSWLLEARIRHCGTCRILEQLLA
jgi:hypothetical protein